jgi:hypothetical protein
MTAAKKALTPAQGEIYELPVIQDVDAYGVDGGTSLKFSVISSDRHIASVHARLNADQAVAPVRGTKLALRPDAGDEDGAQARIFTRVRAVRQENAADGSKSGYLNSSPRPRVGRWSCESPQRTRPIWLPCSTSTP